MAGNNFRKSHARWGSKKLINSSGWRIYRLGVKNTAAVAQLGERVTCNHQVAGSNPAGGFVFMDLGSQSVNFGQRGLIGKGEWRKSRSMCILRVSDVGV